MRKQTGGGFINGGRRHEISLETHTTPKRRFSLPDNGNSAKRNGIHSISYSAMAMRKQIYRN